MTEHTFVLEGYVLDKYADGVQRALEHNYNAYVEIHEPEDPAEAPEAFENNAFASPVEGITETYSMPGPGEIDPNPIMAFFYYFFFGMMFSDAGYGIMVMIACGLLGYGKFLEPGKRKMFHVFLLWHIHHLWIYVRGILRGCDLGILRRQVCPAAHIAGSGGGAADAFDILCRHRPGHVCIGLGIKFYQQVKAGI